MAVSSAATATAELLLHQRTGFIDGQFPAVKIGAVEFGNRIFGGFVIHFHEPESLRASGHAVGDDADRIHFADLGKQVAEVLL